MKVSVIMNCYNSDTYLREAIDSVYAQTYTNWEIIFWDNQSSDKSAEIARSYDGKLKYFCSENYLKLGEGRNRAMEKATGDLIAFLDCDDQWLPKKLEKQVSIFEKSDDVKLVYSNYIKHIQETGYEFEAITKPQPSGHVFKDSLIFYPVGILTAIIRQDVLNALDHWFDPTLNLVEDYDFFMRIILTGQLEYIHETLAIYREHQQNHTSKFRADFPDEMIISLNKLKQKNTDSKYHKLIELNIKQQKVKRASYYFLFKHQHMNFLRNLYENDLLSLGVLLTVYFNYKKSILKKILLRLKLIKKKY
ncbi:MAG: glycosyltransferase [Candidatus Marinamargulisbacteria bacterium]